MKTLYWVLAVIIVAAGVWFYFGRKEVAAPRGEQIGTLEYTKNAKGDRVHEESTDVYDITATYPNSSPAGTNAVVRMEEWVSDYIAQFKTDGKLDNLTAEDKQIQGISSDRKYALAIEYKSYTGARAASYVFTAYQDTLGAHPNGFYHTFTFDTKTGAELELEDIFVSGARYLDKLSAEAYAQVKAELETRSGAALTEDMLGTVRIGTSPTPETLQFFYLDGANLVIIIPPYQAAAYAAGTFEVKIPLSSLSDILKLEYR